MKLRRKGTIVSLDSPPRSPIEGKKVRLREKRLSDARNDYLWQSDPELAKLDAAPVLHTSYGLYLLDYAAEMQRHRHDRFPLAIETLDGLHIGNCSCYDIDEKKGEAQFGIMIGNRDYWGKGYGTDAVTTMVDYVFQHTTLGRLYLKTLDWNLRAQRCFLKCGFTPFGHFQRNGYRFVLMELKRHHWEEMHSGQHPQTSQLDQT